MPTAQARKKARQRKWRDRLYWLSVMIVVLFFVVTVLVFFFPIETNNTALLLLGTWQALVLAVGTYWYRGRKDEDDE